MKQQDRVFRRSWGQALPTIVSGEGVYLHDAEGRTYIDAVGGIYVVGIGYGVATVAEAMAEQAKKIAFVYGGNFATEAESRLADEIVRLAPPGFAKAYFVSGGSEANEVAIKIARKYQRVKGRESRWRMVGRWQSYHGATMATLSVSGKVARRTDYLPYMLNFPRVAAPNSYRCPPGMSLGEYGRACADETERAILQEDPDSISAMIVEPITGAGSGAIVPPDGYFERLREICDRFDILLIADEVITGFGRTGESFACRHFGAVPDIITFGKGVSSGYAPLGGVLVHERVVKALEGSGASGLFTGYTYSGHAVSCAAGLAVMKVLDEQNLIAKARNDGAWFFERARDHLTHRMIGDIRGRGLLMGIEFVRDRVTKAPFDPADKVQQRVVDAAFRRGLIVRGETGCVDGVRGDHLLLAPPLTATRDELATILDRLAAAVAEVEGAVLGSAASPCR